MSVFLLPVEMCKNMEQIMCKFWLRSNPKKTKSILWMCWDGMCKAKKFSGLGFRHIHDFNVAFLGKKGWRLITNLDSLVERIFKARYYPRSNSLSANLGENPNYVRRSV